MRQLLDIIDANTMYWLAITISNKFTYKPPELITLCIQYSFTSKKLMNLHCSIFQSMAIMDGCQINYGFMSYMVLLIPMVKKMRY
jgi:hypothetical protein